MDERQPGGQQKQARRKRLFLWVSGGLGLLLIAVIVIILIVGGEPAAEESPLSAGSSLPESSVLVVEDLYRGQTAIPRFDLPLNELDPAGFSSGTGGSVSYEGALAGIDVSEHQGDIDWQQVADSGVDFAMLRIGYRGLTQGLINEDSNFAANFDGAKDAGLPVGVYFFSQAVTETEARAEAEFVLDILDGRALDYPVVFDWEQPQPGEDLPANSLRAYGLTGEEATACSAAFCQAIREAGYRPGVYVNKHLAYEFFDMDAWKDVEIWYAEYQPKPSLYYAFDMWQYTDSGAVPGIDGGVDLNLWFQRKE